MVIDSCALSEVCKKEPFYPVIWFTKKKLLSSHLYKYMRMKGAYSLENLPTNNIDARDLVDTSER